MIEQYSKVTWLKVRKIVESCPCFHRYLSLPVINIFARGNLTSWIMIFHEGSLSISEEETFYFPTGILCLLRTSTRKPISVLRLIKIDMRDSTFFSYDTHWSCQKIVCQYLDGIFHDRYDFFVKIWMDVHCCSPCIEIYVPESARRTVSQYIIDWKWTEMFWRVNTEYSSVEGCVQGL